MLEFGLGDVYLERAQDLQCKHTIDKPNNIKKCVASD